MNKIYNNGDNGLASRTFTVEFNDKVYMGTLEDLVIPTITIPELNRTFRGTFKRWSENTDKYYIKDILTGDMVVFKQSLGLPDIYYITVSTENSTEADGTTHVLEHGQTSKYYLDKSMAVADYDSFKRVYGIMASEHIGGMTKETHEESNIIFRSKRFTFKEHTGSFSCSVTVYANWIDDSAEDEDMHKAWVNWKKD